MSGYGYGYGYAYGAAPRAAVVPVGPRIAGAGLQLDGSARLQTDLATEAQIFQARKELCTNLAAAEQAEDSAAKQLMACQQRAAAALQAAQEQASRAQQAENIHAAAMNEYRVREAEAQMAIKIATDAKAIFDRAEAAFKQAQAVRTQEVSAAQKAAEVARAAEVQLNHSSNAEAATASTLSRVQHALGEVPEPRPYAHQSYAPTGQYSGQYAYY